VRVLVIDDEEVIRDVLGTLLSREGYDVAAAASAGEAIAMFDAENYDIVLLDLMLPDRPGLEVLREIRHRDPDAVVVIVTAYSSIEGAIEAMRVGAFHYIFRRQFFAISLDHREEGHAAAQGLSVRLWDFLFYASFGFVVTSSVAIAGVLLVFCYLIVPSVAAMLYADRIGPRLAIGWTMGTIVSALGIYLSVKLDLPTGATMVCTFGAVLILMALLRPLLLRGRAA